jgi:hypothetical protein
MTATAMQGKKNTAVLETTYIAHETPMFIAYSLTKPPSNGGR